MQESKIVLADALEGNLTASPRIPVEVPGNELQKVEEDMSMLPFPISLVNPSKFQTMPRQQKRLWWNKRKVRLAMTKHSRKMNRKQT